MAANFSDINHIVDDHKKKQHVSKPPEVEPVLNGNEKSYVSEVVEHEPDPEVAQFVQSKSETIKLPGDVKKLGVQATGSTKFPATQALELPLADEEIYKGLHEPIISSFRWLAEVMKYILKHAHLTLKKVHGKIIRVVQYK